MSDREPKVFIPHWNATFHYHKAEIYGKLVHWSPKDFDDVDGSMQNSILMNQLIENVESYNPDLDFMLVSGSPVLVATAIGIALQRHGRVKILRFNKQHKEYVPLTLEIPNE